jgi:hypothetical protein
VAVRQRSKGAVTLKDMRDSFATGVDNTGNVCLWPAEEVMAHYILSRASEFEGKNICELGAGVGLCGLAMARALKTNSLLLTDGNAQVVDTLQRALEVPVFCAACLCFSVCVHALVCVCVSLDTFKCALEVPRQPVLPLVRERIEPFFLFWLPVPGPLSPLESRSRTDSLLAVVT